MRGTFICTFTLTLAFVFGTTIDLFAQKPTVKMSGFIQLYSTYTYGQSEYTDAGYVELDPRWNNMVRRGRFNLSSQITDHLDFKFTVAAERMGQDVNTAIQGNWNTGALPYIGVWNLFIKWKMIENDERLHLTAGYFSPKLGRAHMTNPHTSPSFEKSWSQNYTRRHMVGFGTGRATGINLGGLFYSPDQLININYDLGVFNPIIPNLDVPDTKYSPLVTGRINLSIGDPEMTKYTTNLSPFNFKKRNGVSLGLGASTQGETARWESSQMYGIDWQANYGYAYLEGEYYWMTRSHSGAEVMATSAYARAGYLLSLPSGFVLEPTLMYQVFEGEMGAADIQMSRDLGLDAGADRLWDIGINLHINSRTKVGLHYVQNTGDLGEAAEGSPINNYFSRGGFGIQRGDYLGLVLNLKI